MKIKPASYLYKNRHGVYYFRVVIPKKYLCYFTYKREIKRSLKTENKHIALKLARKLMTDFDKMIADIQSGKVRTSQLISAKNVQLSNGVSLEEINIDLGDPKLEQEALMNLINSGASSAPSQQVQPQKTYQLEHLCKMYFADMLAKDKWNESTYNENIRIFEILFELLGKKTEVTSITRIHLNDAKAKVRNLPPNKNKQKRYINKSINEILKMADVVPMSKTSCDKYMLRFSGFFNWAKIEGYLSVNIAEKLSDGPSKKNDRVPFSQNDITSIFHPDNFTNHKKAAQFWVPIIALYSGARLAEICQFYLDDIQVIDGIYVFSIRDDKQTQRIKNDASRRVFPIHPTILHLGFLKYIDFLIENNQERLFPELKYTSIKAGYSASKSRWFSRYLKKINIHETNAKVFHSFRNTFINHLKQKKVGRDFVSTIAGHSLNSITFEGYAEGYEPSVLKPYIDLVDYNLIHTPFVIDAKKIKQSWK